MDHAENGLLQLVWRVALALLLDVVHDEAHKLDDGDDQRRHGHSSQVVAEGALDAAPERPVELPLLLAPDAAPSGVTGGEVPERQNKESKKQQSGNCLATTAN